MIKKELAMAELGRKLCRDNYTAYCYHVHRGAWIPSNFHKWLTNKVQEFIETDTGHAYDILCLSVPPQFGKKCSDDTPVLTNNGWKTHGDLQIGDYVFGRDGEKARITNILNVSSVPDCEYLVEFSDGEKVHVHAQHEWVVFDKSKHKEITIETQDMFNSKIIFKEGRKERCRYQVDSNTCVDFIEANLPVEPYILGAWLGDGHTTKPTIVHSKDDVAVIDKIKSYGYAVSAETIHSKTGVITTNFYGDLYMRLKSIGFTSRKGDIKHIPDIYKFSSKEQRLELLAGLIDTDGYVYQKNGRITFSNINKRLIDDVEQICISLGFKTTICETPPAMSSSNIQGKHTVYQLSFNPDMNIPTALSRKKVSNFIKVKRKRGIKSITIVNAKAGKCITVEGGIYLVGKKLIPTHNSTSITETLPSWYEGKNPDKKTILVSYNETFASRFGRRNRQKLEEYGSDIFNIKLGKATDTEIEIFNTAGCIISRGILSGITGNPANLMLIDDPVKSREEADSKTIREKIYAEWENSMRTRLAPGAKVIVIMTRWHDDDLFGRLSRQEKNVTVLNVPCEAGENDILGRKVGECLCADIGKDDEWLAETKAAYGGGNRAWYALFQGNPVADGGNIIKEHWWRYYDVLPEMDYMIMSVDCAFKDADKNDYVSIGIWGKNGADAYLIDATKKHLGFLETIDAIKALTAKYTALKGIYIEDKANGTAVIATLRRLISGIVAITPTDGKVARVYAITDYIEGGNVYLPKYASFTEDFVSECSSFPNGEHDDQVDMMSQALTKLMKIPVKQEKEEKSAMELHREKALNGGRRRG